LRDDGDVLQVSVEPQLHCRLPRAALRVSTRWDMRGGTWGGVLDGGHWATRRHAGFYRRRAILCGLRECRQCGGRWGRGRQRQRRGRQWWRRGETHSRQDRPQFFVYTFHVEPLLGKRGGWASEEDRAGAKVGAGGCSWRDCRFACRLRDNGRRCREKARALADCHHLVRA